MEKKQMTLLIEQLMPSESNMVLEASQDGKSFWLNGIMMQSGIKNRNGREYPLQEINSAVESAIQRIKEQNGIMGELDHPQTLQINLDRVSHVITELKMVGANACGKARLLDTPMGKIAQEFIRAGVRPGFSSRGAGNVNEGGGVTGFQFVTVDIVAQPSAPNAYPESVYEGLDRSKTGRNVLSLAEALREDPKAQKYFKDEVLKFLASMNYAKR